MKQFLLILSLLFPFCANADPGETIETFQQALLEFAQGETQGFEERYKQLAPIVEATHDVDYIAKLTLGRHWHEMNPDDRRGFSSRFRRLAIASYAARFPRFNGESFKIMEEQAQRRGIVLVRTELQRRDAGSLGFDYLLHETPDGWRIVNILVDGISDLALKRAEYSALLRDGSAGELFQALDEQFERLQAGL